MIKFQNITGFTILLVLILFFITELKAQNNTMNGVSPSGDNSKVLSYDIPEKLNTGQEYVVTVTMLNSGNNKWTKKDNYQLSLFDQSDNMFMADVWGIKEIPLPYDVNPGEKVMFLFKITAPATTGTYNCRWVMTRNNEFFGEFTANMVSVDDEMGSLNADYEGNNSQIMNVSIPEFMNSGEKYLVVITIKNTGTKPWSSSYNGEYSIAAVTDSVSVLYNDWNKSVYNLSGTIDTGQVSTIEFYVTAPPVSGIYSLQWRMKKGETFFGQETKRAYVNVSGSSKIRVDTKKYSSQFVSQDIPHSMYVKDYNAVSLTFKNTGTRTWVKGYDQLVIIDTTQNVSTLNVWGIGYIQLPENVDPGNTVTFNFRVRPLETGWHYFQMMMMTQEGIFGEPSKSVEVIISQK